MNEFVIRKMKQRDLRAVVDVHLAAFQGFFLTFLGSRFLRLYYRCIIDYGQIGFVAHEGGSVAGFVTGIENGSGFYRKALTRRGLLFCAAAVPVLAADPARVLPRLARAVAKKPSGPDDAPRLAATLTSIAVDPNSTSKGLGHALVAAFSQEVAWRGLQSIYLETDADGNEAVLRFYEREGFRKCRTYTTPEGRRLDEFVLDL